MHLSDSCAALQYIHELLRRAEERGSAAPKCQIIDAIQCMLTVLYLSLITCSTFTTCSGERRSEAVQLPSAWAALRGRSKR